MRNHDLRMRLHPRLYSPRLPLPKDHVTLSVPAANPFPVWRESDLARVPGDRMPSKPLVPRLTEIVRAVDQDLVIQRLSRKVFLCQPIILETPSERKAAKDVSWDALLG